MSEEKSLEQRIKELEEKLKKLEIEFQGLDQKINKLHPKKAVLPVRGNR